MDTLRSKKEEELYVCEKCDYTCCKKYNLTRHISTAKHQWIHFGYILDTKKGAKGAKKKEQKKEDHIMKQNNQLVQKTPKQNEQNEQKKEQKKEQKIKDQLIREQKQEQKKQTEQKISEQNEQNEKNEQQNEFINYECICGNKYKYSQGLSKHKLRCVQSQTAENLLKPDDNQNNLINYLIKENQDFKNLILEIVKKDTTNIIHTNSHNKTFNLNVFLNETCKDAMNIMDFVDSLKLQISDLETVGKLGFIEGISSIIIKNLNSMDETKRPVHCTDSKREVMYIKDEDKWEKENDEKKKLRKAIKYIAHKNTKLLPEYRQKYPNCDKSISKLSDKYDKLVIEAFGGKGDNDSEKEDKIIRNIAKSVTVDKQSSLS